MARKSAQPTSDTECINVSIGALLCFQSRLRSSYIYAPTFKTNALRLVSNEGRLKRIL